MPVFVVRYKVHKIDQSCGIDHVDEAFALSCIREDPERFTMEPEALCEGAGLLWRIWWPQITTVFLTGLAAGIFATALALWGR